MNLNLINDIINDYTIIYEELYKKRYSSLNELLEKSKEDLNILKEEIISLKEINLLQQDLLSEKNKNYILCIKEVLRNKLNKYIVNFLNILKKYIQYKLWTKKNSHETITLMKEISDFPRNSLECQNKVVEVIQTLLFASFFELNENDIITIYLINLKAFNNTNNYQNADFKNPIRLLFITLTDIVYKSSNNELITKITKFIFSLLIKDDDNNNDNEYLELIKDFSNNIYIKCLSLELLSQGLKIIKSNNLNNNYLDENINTKLILVIKNNLNEMKNQSKNNDQAYIYLLKLCRISMIIINNYSIDFDILKLLIGFLENDNSFQWEKNISMECLQEILSNNSLLINIYNYDKEIITNIFSILSSLYQKINESQMDFNSNDNKTKNLKTKKQIDKNHIYLQGDESYIIKENECIFTINDIKECLNNIINSFSSMMNEYKLTINNINYNLSKDQDIIKQIILLTSTNIKTILFDLIEKEYNSNIYDISNVQKTLSFIQNIIILYSSLNLFFLRDEYLKLISGLCLNFENEKNIVICSSLIGLSKCTHFFNRKSFIIIFHTIEKIHINYNYNKEERNQNKNVDLIIKDIFQSYQKFFTTNELEKNLDEKSNDIEYRSDKIEKENLLCSAINTMFIDSKALNDSLLKNIIGALFDCLKMAINEDENNEKQNEKEEKIIFYLTKILTLALLNIENIFILFDDYLVPIINLLIEKKIILNFTVNLVCSIIKEILINYKKIESNIKQKDNNSNRDNNWWLNEKWQKTLFTPLDSFTKEHNLIESTKNRLFICITTIIQQSGNYIDLFGWESILKISQILINYNIEEVFLIVKLILNDYNSFLTIFNVMPIITLLGTFISYQKDRNICFNSIELFWSCANIVEKYHKGKTIINEQQQKIFEELLKEQKFENFDIFYNGLYYKIFSQLLRINSDMRNDIRRSAIKVFTEIFVSKINSIEYENSFKIINDIFFNTFIINSQKYIESEKNKIIKEEEITNQSITIKENKIEQTFHASLLSIIKILKSYCIPEQNQENEKKNENIENIVTLYLKKLGEIIPFGTTDLNTDILHGLSEIKNIQINNKFILPMKLDLFFEIMDKTKEFIDSERFKIFLFNKMKCIKFLISIISSLNDFFCNESNYNYFSLPLNQIFKKIYEILDFVLSGNYIVEKKSLDSYPQRLTEVENTVFTFIENIPSINEQYIIDFIIKYINYDLNNSHNGVLCKRDIESLVSILNKSKDNHFILKEKGKNELLHIFEKLNLLFKEMNNTSINKYYINSKNKEIEFIGFIKSIKNLFLAIINKADENSEEILSKIIQFSQNKYDQCIKEIKMLKDENNLNDIIDLYKEIIKNIIQFLFNELLPFMYMIFNQKENEIKSIEKQLLKMLYIENDKNIVEKKNIYEQINEAFIDCLFAICKYQPNEEVLNYTEKSKLIINKNIYINNFINFKKKCTSLLISKLSNILNEYKKKYENKKEEKISLKIVLLLNQIKNLEVYPDLMILKDKTEAEKESNDNIKFKNKKVHLLYLYNSIIDFISIDNKDIQIIIKEILKIAFNGIELPQLQKIEFD